MGKIHHIMAKRTATSELNHDNWNEEEAPEDAGQFRKAAPDVLQNRVIKAAKRRSMGTPESGLPSKSPFAAFGGFKATSNSSATSTPFSFLSNTSRASSETSNGKVTQPKDEDSHTEEYYSYLKGLNQCVSQWIKSHVDSNPFCILTPIFRDYERYISELDEKEAKKSAPPSESSSEPSEDEVKTKPTDSTPKFSFGSGSGTTGGFTFSSSGAQPFQFSNVAKQPDDGKDPEGDGEEEPPPKVEFKQVTEEGATYSKRCKVFVKKEAGFQERGVGMLYLKPVNEKTQLIVRADTSLGNVILNTLLTSGMPVQRKGANNVMLVCIPTPDMKPPPVLVLLRLKTGADADEVFDKLKEHVQ